MSDLKKTSKNVKEQKKKLFGTSGNPAPKSAKGQAQMEALKDFAQRRYGLEIVPSKGKFDERKGEYRKKDAKVGTDKPDWRGEKGNQISSQSNSGAQSHELGHLEQMPVGREAKEHQTIMDQEVGESVKFGGGPTASFKHPSEVQARAAENPLRRRAGLPPHTPSVEVKEGEGPRIVLGTKDEPAAVRYTNQKGKTVDQLKSGKLLSRENRERMQDIDEGILTYDHKQGWNPSSDPNALINMRAQGRYDEATKRAQGRYKPQQAPTDLSNLSQEDHEAVQEFLKQRKSKLAASEMKKDDEERYERKYGITRYKTPSGYMPNEEDLEQAKREMVSGLKDHYNKTFGLDEGYGKRTGEIIDGNWRRSGPRGTAFDATEKEKEKYGYDQKGVNRPALRDPNRPGDSESGYFLRRDNPSVKAYSKGPIMGRVHAFFNTSDFNHPSYEEGERRIEQAREGHRNTLNELRSMPKPNLPKSEDVSDPYGIGAAMKKSRTGVSDTLGAPHPNTQQKGVNRPKQVYSSHDRNPAIANQGVSEAGHWARSKSNGDSAKNVHTRTLNELRSMPKPNLPKSEMSKVDKPVSSKDPVLGKQKEEKPATATYHEKAKQYLAEKKKLGKSEEKAHESISTPHIMFSMQHPAHGQHDENAHTATLNTLKGMGADVHEIQGNYGGQPETSILVRNPTQDISTAIHHIAGKNGQESVLHSDGKNHELHFLNGEMKGKHVKGSGTDYHSETPQTNYSKLPDGTVFSHKLDFNQIHGE